MTGPKVTIRKARIPSSEITPKGLYLRRREFLQAAGVTAAAALTGVLGAETAGEAAGEKLTITKKMVTTTDKVASLKDISSYNNFVEFGSEKSDPMRYAGRFKPAPWSVAVEGLCGKPGTYRLEDILKPHPLEERIYRLRCVEAWSMVIPWDGFPLGDLLKRFEPKSEARFVEFTTVWRPSEMAGQQVQLPKPLLPWPYKEGLRWDEAMHPLTIVAVGMWGESLPNQDGAPLRLVMPWKYGFKSIKSIVKIRFVEKQPLNTWQESYPSYYGFYANVNPNVNHPMWSQKKERRLGDFLERPTLMFNGYADEVASMYAGMDLKKNF